MDLASKNAELIDPFYANFFLNFTTLIVRTIEE